MSTLSRWRKEHDLRIKYAVPSRLPFFELAGQYLPTRPEATVVDVGPGEAAFAKHLRLGERFTNLYLLDQNESTIRKLRSDFAHAVHYHAPDRLPFSDRSVAFIHLSHIVEHLSPHDLYVFLDECNRVLEPGGTLVVSTPLLWDRFYEDLSHVRPYGPAVFTNYLCTGRANGSAEAIATSYVVSSLTYRYRAVDQASWGSKFFAVDALVRVVKAVLSWLGFRHYIRNGYTLVLTKAS